MPGSSDAALPGTKRASPTSQHSQHSHSLASSSVHVSAAHPMIDLPDGHVMEPVSHEMDQLARRAKRARTDTIKAEELDLPPPASSRLAPIGAELDHHSDDASYDAMSKSGVLGCSWCSRTFRYPSELRTHERVHTGEKPYSCAYCGQRFSASSNLRRHERRHVAQTGGQGTSSHASGNGSSAGTAVARQIAAAHAMYVHCPRFVVEL